MASGVTVSNQKTSADGLPLEGVRVIDLTRVMTGPYCTMMLGDMGADVIKIERPSSGDDTRSWGPPFIGEESAYFLSVNRNKRSIVLDLKQQHELDVLWRLIEDADVFVENFSPGTIGRLGLDYDAVSSHNPRIVYTAISGFGQRGPAAERTAYDLIVQGMSGMMSVTGEQGRMPIKHGVPVADISAGMFAAFATVSALFERLKTGQGKYVDVSMIGSQMAQLTYQAGILFATGDTPSRMGNEHPIIAPYDTFETADGFVNIAAGNDSLWQRFCAAFEMTDASQDSRFETNADRVRNKVALYEVIEATLTRYSSHEIVNRLDEAGVPSGPINDVAEAFEDEQASFLGMHQYTDHATLGKIDQVGFPYQLSGAEIAIRRPPPILGEHTREILAEIGYSAEYLAD